MASIVQLTNLIDSANNSAAIRLEDTGDTLFVGRNATVASTGVVGLSVALSEGGNTVTVQGTLFSAQSAGIAGNLNSDFPGDNRIEVGAGGLISAALNAIGLLGDRNEVYNSGEILAGIDGVRSSGADAVLVNLGTIRAGNQGVDFGDTASVTNAGSILGDQVGVFLGSNSVIGNTGRIAGTQAGGVGVRTVGDDMTIHNHGTISGLEAAAIEIDDSSAAALNTIVNTGTIEGVASAFAMVAGSGIERLENAGTIIGSVSLGGNADVYDGRLGRVLGGVVNGDAGEDLLLGGQAADQFSGGSEDDEIVGGAGDDTVEGGAGGDLLSGGDGARDRLIYSRSGEGVTVNLGNGLTGGGEARGDVIDGFEDVSGSAFNDMLVGSGEANRLSGGRGDDNLNGGLGDDRLVGGDGEDVLIGGRGADVLFGGAGADRFTFGALADSTVDPAGRDRVRDFSQAQGDRLDLSRLDAEPGPPGDQAFDFLGFAAFSGTAGEVRMQMFDGHTLVQADTTGDGLADFAVLLRGMVALTAADFIL
jgi:Ca2+-binding RTX toxin-like protein